MSKLYIGNNLISDTQETMLAAASDVGAIFMWGSDAPPKGCLICNGSAISRTTYSLLFAKIGTTYGAGDGSTTFNVPDMRGRVAVGKDTSQTEFDVLGESGGIKYLQAHEHTVRMSADASPTAGNISSGTSSNTSRFQKDGDYGGFGGVTGAGLTGTTGTGNSGNLQPYRVLSFIIRYLPSLNADKIGDTLPIGTMTEYVSDTAPLNWLLCNGQAVSRADYYELFSVIGVSYGSGDGSITFNIPDMRGRVAVGKDIAQSEFDTLNMPSNYKGEKTHQLIVAEIPAHSHNIYYGKAASGSAVDVAGGDMSAITGNWIRKNSGDGAHNNLQPYRVLNYIIKAKNTVPVEAVVEDSLNSVSTVNALSAYKGKALNDRLSAVERKICCRAYHNTFQASGTSTYTYLSLNSTSTDTDSIHNNQVNNSRLVCRTAGLYLMVGNVEFGMTNDTGIRASIIRKNGITVIASNVSGAVPLAIGYTTGTVSTVIEMNVGDYVELGIAQTSGTSLTIGQFLTTTFSMILID